MTKFLTNSEMTEWRRCRRKWWLRTYRKLVPRHQSDFNKPLGIGNRVHDALAAYYDPELKSDPVEFVRASALRDLQHCSETEHDAIRKEEDLALKMVEGYLEWLAETGEDQAITVIEAERARTARLQEGDDVFLLSKLDARVQHDVFGSRVALEHKTVGSLKQHLPELRLNTQCLTEHLVEYLALIEEGEERPDAAHGVLFNMLLKSKRTARARGPFYSRTYVGHTLTELRNHWRHVVAISNEISEAEHRLDGGEDPQFVAHPNPTRDCHWDCPFFRCCVMFDSDDDVESYIDSNYVVGDPLSRYRGLVGGPSPDE